MICSECSGFWGHGHSCKNARPLLSFQHAIDNVGALLVETRDDLWHREAELAAIKADRAADTDRLDWLEKSGWNYESTYMIRFHGVGHHLYENNDSSLDRQAFGESIRVAIDAARKDAK